MGTLPKLNNFDYLLVVIDQLMSLVYLVPTTTMVTARGVTWLILKEVMRLHGIPESIAKFIFIFWKELHRLMGGASSSCPPHSTYKLMEQQNELIGQ